MFRSCHLGGGGGVGDADPGSAGVYLAGLHRRPMAPACPLRASNGRVAVSTLGSGRACPTAVIALYPSGRSAPSGWCIWGGGGVAQGLSIQLFAFCAAYWPLATAHSDPLWARTCLGGGGGISCRVKFAVVNFAAGNSAEAPRFCVGNSADTPRNVVVCTLQILKFRGILIFALGVLN